MTARGRRLRIGVTLVVAVLLLGGTFWGEDDHFPFGPFRMYARATKTNGRISVPRIVAVDAAGRERSVRAGQLGLRRAELEGQIARFRDDPTLLRHLAVAYRNVNPEAPPLRRIQLVMRGQRVVDSRPVGAPTEEVVAAWDAP